MRSLLFVPAHKTELIEKAIIGDADAIILDLEDACPAWCHSKGVANVKKYYDAAIPVLVRIRDMGDAWLHEFCDGIILPKAESGEMVRQVKMGRMYALIETAMGVMNVMDIAKEVDGLVFGNEDYRADSMCNDFSFARHMVLNAARAYNIQAIDTVNVDVHDLVKLDHDCMISSQLGYDGKLCIHPKEIEIIHKHFTPTEEEYEYSKKVVSLYNKAEKEGSGVAILDGVYVAPPMVKLAEKKIEKYETYQA
jgi:citrate lyase subunit beta/citryl-CoA lyase